MTNDELRALAEAALKHPFGYIRYNWDAAITPERVIALLDENAALVAALTEIKYGDHLSDHCRAVAVAALASVNGGEA